MGVIMKNFFYIAGVVAGFALASTAQAGVNLVVNGDFSSPNTNGGWIAGASGAYGWHNDNPADWVEIGSAGTYGLPAANAGGQALEINGNASPATVYQDISGLVVGQWYKIEYLYGGRAGSTGPGAFMTASFGGVNLATNSGSAGVWTDNIFSVQATATTERLAFTGSTPFCGGTCGNVVTNVSVAAPEPATWALMLAGFGGLAFAGYRRKMAVA
jgi:hypothetical protein